MGPVKVGNILVREGGPDPQERSLRRSEQLKRSCELGGPKSKGQGGPVDGEVQMTKRS